MVERWISPRKGHRLRLNWKGRAHMELIRPGSRVGSSLSRWIVAYFTFAVSILSVFPSFSFWYASDWQKIVLDVKFVRRRYAAQSS